MRAFATLLDRLSFTASRNAKLVLVRDYLKAAPDPERGWALACLTGELTFDAAKPAMIRKAVEARVDPTLFRWSYDYVGDLAETVALVWPAIPELFLWLEGRGPRPNRDAPGRFRPAMLAQAVDEIADFPKLDPADYAAEWKWDGIRVQAVRERGADGEMVARLYSRTGDEISGAFPDLMAALEFQGVIDGELLVLRDHRVQPFGDLQQRLNRKVVDARTMAAHPAGIRAYDLMAADGQDLRALPFQDRRMRLEDFITRHGNERLDLSPLAPFRTWEKLAELRANPPEGDASQAEGLMLKRWDSVYQAGRPKGPWFKWKRDPFLIDAVLMYAQRGHGKRSSFYSDYTFGVWTPEGALTPVGKAYFGFTDEELKEIDKFVRDNTIERFGPVRSVRADRGFGLVFEVAFEGLQRSTRHKSGVAMRFPRINRIRWDKPAAEADTLATLEVMLDKIQSGRTDR